MKRLDFPSTKYLFDQKKESYIYSKETEYSVISPLELLWAGINNSPIQTLKKPDFKVLKKLKRKIREITRPKDKDHDSRIPLDGPQVLILESNELSILTQCLEANNFIAAISDDVDDLYTIIDSAQEYDPPKPDICLVKNQE